ncbi:MAG TPA: ATP-binding protein [Thermoanaerobaculia bacterium]|jgi:hypothetical protein
MIDTSDPHLHDALHTPAALRLGTLHWYLTRAVSQLDLLTNLTVPAQLGGAFTVTLLTSFGELVGPDEVRWWVWTRESDLPDLKRRTGATFHAAQRLQRGARRFRRSTFPDYESLLRGIANFAAEHVADIEEVERYAAWLHSRDELAPSMLFSAAEWGTTRVSDRWAEPAVGSITDQATIVNLTEIACGVRHRILRYQVDAERLDILDEMVDAYDDYEGTIAVPDATLVPRVVHAVLQELSEYFEFLRNSFRNIVNAVDQRLASDNLVFNETFWRSFITKARHTGRTETQTWDFKQQLGFWIAARTEREEAKLKFCELVAGFANADGGVFIVGVRDADRAVVGVTDMENRVKYTRQVLDACFGPSAAFVSLQQIIVRDDAGRDRTCLAIVIAQTNDAKSFTHPVDGTWYPLRQEAGLIRLDKEGIKRARSSERITNFDFLQRLQRWSIDA